VRHRWQCGCASGETQKIAALKFHGVSPVCRFCLSC